MSGDIQKAYPGPDDRGGFGPGPSLEPTKSLPWTTDADRARLVKEGLWGPAEVAEYQRRKVEASAALMAAIRVFTVEAPNGQPNGESERQIEWLSTLLKPGAWPGSRRETMMRLASANDALSRLCDALANDTKALRVAAEAFFGGDFRAPAPPEPTR